MDERTLDTVARLLIVAVRYAFGVVCVVVTFAVVYGLLFLLSELPQ